jgi:hypothetical protein
MVFELYDGPKSMNIKSKWKDVFHHFSISSKKKNKERNTLWDLLSNFEGSISSLFILNLKIKSSNLSARNES